MNIEKLQEGEVLTLVLDGKLDTQTAPQLEAVLLPALDEAKKTVLDFTKVSYVSSAGLRVLLQGQKKSVRGNVSMTITGVAPSIMEIFELVGFADVLNIGTVPK